MKKTKTAPTAVPVPPPVNPLHEPVYFAHAQIDDFGATAVVCIVVKRAGDNIGVSYRFNGMSDLELLGALQVVANDRLKAK